MSLFNALIPSLAQRGQSLACEQPRSSVKPLYEVHETDDAWGLTVYLPGVTKEGLEFSVDQNQVRVTGKRAWTAPSTWTALYRETGNENFELVLDHENAIDPEKIHAEIKDGVLRASLPKAATIKPRKIAIN
jgi:HSP20 family molecular chaperone IbpA